LSRVPDIAAAPGDELPSRTSRRRAKHSNRKSR
jgi:hypothetical protein